MGSGEELTFSSLSNGSVAATLLQWPLGAYFPAFSSLSNGSVAATRQHRKLFPWGHLELSVPYLTGVSLQPKADGAVPACSHYHFQFPI